MASSNLRWTAAPSIYCPACGRSYDDPWHPEAHIVARCAYCASRLYCVSAQPTKLYDANGEPAGPGLKWAWELQAPMATGVAANETASTLSSRSRPSPGR